MRPTIHHGSKKLRTMVMLKIFGQYNRSSTRPGHRRLRPEGARPPHREEHFKSGSIIPSHCEGSHSSSLQERLFRPSISTRQMIDQYAQTVVPSSSDRPCGLRHGQGPAFRRRAPVLLQTGHTFGVGHQITDFWQGLALDGRFASGGGENSHRPSWDFVRGRLLYHHQLASAASATHPENAIQSNPEVVPKTSSGRRNYETFAQRNRQCCHSLRERKTIEMRQLTHVR